MPREFGLGARRAATAAAKTCGATGRATRVRLAVGARSLALQVTEKGLSMSSPPREPSTDKDGDPELSPAAAAPPSAGRGVRRLEAARARPSEAPARALSSLAVVSHGVTGRCRSLPCPRIGASGRRGEGSLDGVDRRSCRSDRRRQDGADEIGLPAIRAVRYLQRRGTPLLIPCRRGVSASGARGPHAPIRRSASFLPESPPLESRPQPSGLSVPLWDADARLRHDGPRRSANGPGSFTSSPRSPSWCKFKAPQRTYSPPPWLELATPLERSCCHLRASGSLHANLSATADGVSS